MSALLKSSAMPLKQNNLGPSMQKSWQFLSIHNFHIWLGEKLLETLEDLDKFKSLSFLISLKKFQEAMEFWLKIQPILWMVSLLEDWLLSIQQEKSDPSQLMTNKWVEMLRRHSDLCRLSNTRMHMELFAQQVGNQEVRQSSQIKTRWVNTLNQLIFENVRIFAMNKFSMNIYLRIVILR